MRAAWQRKFNTVVGTLLWIGGVAFIGAALHIYNTPAVPMPYPIANVPDIDPDACAATLRQLGYTAYRNQGAGEISVSDMALGTDTKTQDRFTRASMAIQVCKLPLVSFCAGAACPDGNSETLRFTLNDGRQTAQRHQLPTGLQAITGKRSSPAAPAKPAPPLAAAPR